MLCFRCSDSLSVNFISDRRFSIIVCGQPLSIKRILKFEIFSSNVVFEEFVRRILKASPLTNRFLTLGGRVTRGAMCVLEGFRFLKMCLYIKDGVFLESCALHTTVSKNTVSVSDISAVNLIVQVFTFVFTEPYLGPLYRSYIIVQILNCKILERVLLNGAI